MAYRRRLFKKRLIKRKRRFTKRKRVYPKRKYDTGHWVTCQASKNIHFRDSWTTDPDYSSRFQVYWGTNAGGGADEIML